MSPNVQRTVLYRFAFSQFSSKFQFTSTVKSFPNADTRLIGWNRFTSLFTAKHGAALPLTFRFNALDWYRLSTLRKYEMSNFGTFVIWLLVWAQRTTKNNRTFGEQKATPNLRTIESYFWHLLHKIQFSDDICWKKQFSLRINGNQNTKEKSHAITKETRNNSTSRHNGCKWVP